MGTTTKTVKNYLGKKVFLKTLRLKDLNGWEAHITSMNNKSISIIKRNTSAHIFNSQDEMVAWLMNDGVLILKNDPIVYPVKGWSIAKAMRFTFLKTQKPLKTKSK